jgi:hypothetical protein
MPMWKSSSIEHVGLAGESACPTCSAWPAGNSQEFSHD